MRKIKNIPAHGACRALHFFFKILIFNIRFKIMKKKSLGVFYLQFNGKTLCYEKLLNTLHKDKDEGFFFFFLRKEM